MNEIEKEKKKDLENEHEKNEQNENEKDKGKEIEEIKEKEKENRKENENEEREYAIENENQSKNCILEKCSECTEESTKLNLCKKCNTEKEYYPLNTGENILTNQYINCYNEITKPKGFYLDKIEEQYNLCYSSCLTCDYGGDGIENNCTSCKNNQILKPDILDSTNCVIKCNYFYYYQDDQYKCTKTENCPDTYQFEINEKRKCIEKCEKDNEYHIQYDGECYKVPPEGTVYDAIVKISKDADITKCKLNEKVLRLLSNDNITEHEIETKAKLYAEEFHYTNKHVTVYKNDIYNITIYKDKNCFSDLELKLDEIDFDECNEKIKQDLNIEDNLIIVILSKLINGIPTLIDGFVFNPNTGEKINYIEICGEETLIIKKDSRNQIMYSDSIESMEDLTEQGINIFDPDSDFYTDICFHFKSPIDGKDIPLKDRLRLFYPNITLCNEGCSIKGVNLTSWKAICECKLRDLVQNNIFGNNLVIQKTIGEVQDILMKTNIEVLKCYKDLFNLEMYKTNIGIFIISGFIFIQIIFIFIYFFAYKIGIKKYVLSITDKYISSLLDKKNKNLIDNSSQKNILPKNAPPKNSTNEEDKTQKEKMNFERKIIPNKSKTVIKKNDGNKRISIRIPRKYSNKMNLSSSNEYKQNSKDEIIVAEKANLDKKDFEPIIPNNIININFDEYIMTDPNQMEYDDAIRKDKRTFCQYFSDRIKSEQISLNTFINYEILKPIPTKIILLILNFDLYLIINGLFFNENYISDLLHSGPDTFWSIINRLFDRIVIITITGVIINYIIEFFFVEETKIKRIFKVEKDSMIVLKYEIIQTIKNIYIRFNIFIVLTCIIMMFSLYYIFCFNNVYPFIKIEWLKSSFIIIAVMQILPIIVSLIDTSIRFISFKCKSERLFKLSSIFL